MAKKKIPIFNPGVDNSTPKTSEITKEEKAFLESDKKEGKKDLAKPRSISMKDSFYEEVVQFVKDFPEEGSASALMIRATIMYMRHKRK